MAYLLPVLFYFLLWGKVGGVEICTNLCLALVELFVSLVSISIWCMHCLIVKEKHLCGLSDLSVHSLWVARPVSACGQTCAIFAFARPVSACGQTCAIFALCGLQDLSVHVVRPVQSLLFVGCKTCQCMWSDLWVHALLFGQCGTFVRQVVGCVQLCDSHVNKVYICICHTCGLVVVCAAVSQRQSIM